MTKTVLIVVFPIPNKRENNMKKCEKSNMSFISVILSMLGTGRVNRDFSPEIFISKIW